MTPCISATDQLSIFVQTERLFYFIKELLWVTGKSFSEVFILASTDPPNYDKRLFIKLPVQHMFCAYSFHVLNWSFHEQSVVVFGVNWYKNKSFWQGYIYLQEILYIANIFFKFRFLPFYSKKSDELFLQSVFLNTVFYLFGSKKQLVIF